MALPPPVPPFLPGDDGDEEEEYAAPSAATVWTRLASHGPHVGSGQRQPQAPQRQQHPQEQYRSPARRRFVLRDASLELSQLEPPRRLFSRAATQPQTASPWAPRAVPRDAPAHNTAETLQRVDGHLTDLERDVAARGAAAVAREVVGQLSRGGATAPLDNNGLADMLGTLYDQVLRVHENSRREQQQMAAYNYGQTVRVADDVRRLGQGLGQFATAAQVAALSQQVEALQAHLRMPVRSRSRSRSLAADTATATATTRGDDDSDDDVVVSYRY